MPNIKETIKDNKFNPDLFEFEGQLGLAVQYDLWKASTLSANFDIKPFDDVA